MSPEKTLEALYSLDNHQAWLGAWEIVRAGNTLLDKEFLPNIKEIRSALNSLPNPLKPSVRDSRDIVRVALHIPEIRNNNICRCNIYPSTDQLLPKSQAKYGLVDILDAGELSDAWEKKYTCKCKFCEQAFSVLENHGYHYPWSAWKKL